MLEEQLGAGAMGVVVRARHAILGHAVAIKFVHPTGAHSADVRERFLREARLTATLDDEHIARALDFGTWQPEGGEGSATPYIVMEYLCGRDLLAELRARGPLPLDEVVDYVTQAAAGLAVAHARGIVHRDVKLSNLFLARRWSGDTVLKILDFGISKNESDRDLDLTKTGATIGSPMYMSPEQVRSSKAVDARADVWALGVVMYFLLTGRAPFRAEGPLAISAAIVADLPTPLRELRPDVPEEVEAVVAQCLEKDLDWRIGSVDELALALAPFARGGSGRVETPTPRDVEESPTSSSHEVPSTPGPAARASWARAVLFAVVAFLVVGAAVLARVAPRKAPAKAPVALDASVPVHSWAAGVADPWSP